MMARIRETLERFRVHFDSYQLERELEPEIAGAVALLDTYEAEGTRWARTSAHGDDKDRPLVRSSDGSYLYFAYDVAYLRHKLERFDRAIYVLGADHHGYVNRLKAAAAMMGYDPDRVEVLIYQLVHVTSGGEATKVSKRRGDVVFLDELIDEIGVDAARWYLVSRGHDQTIEIDVDLAAEKTQKNPVLRPVRACAHRRDPPQRRRDGPGRRAAPRSRPRAGGAGAREAPARAPGLVAGVCRAPLTARASHVRDSRRGRLPSLLPPPQGAGLEQEQFRLALCEATQGVVARSLDLIGVDGSGANVTS